jgi:hypothetical protein
LPLSLVYVGSRSDCRDGRKALAAYECGLVEMHSK